MPPKRKTKKQSAGVGTRSKRVKVASQQAQEGESQETTRQDSGPLQVFELQAGFNPASQVCIQAGQGSIQPGQEIGTCIATCINNNHAPPQDCPMPVNTVHLSLSTNVSQNLRNKIISSAYIDLALLLDNSSLQYETEKQIYIGEKGELVAKGFSKAKGKITTISKWTDAFIVYVSVYSAAHPSASQGLLKYMHDVRLGASRCNEGDLGWRRYDEQFRLRRSVDPSIPWEKIDYELWLMFMQSQSQPRPYTSPIAFSHNKCFNYNFKSSCDRPACQYTHKCIKCSEGHPQLSCPLNPHPLPQTK